LRETTAPTAESARQGHQAGELGQAEQIDNPLLQTDETLVAGSNTN
jgi:hypothetical protein